MGSKIDNFFDEPNLSQDPTKAEDDPLADFIQEVDELLVDLAPDDFEFKTDQPAPTTQFAVLEHKPEADPAYEEMRATFVAIMQQTLKPVTRYIKAVVNGIDDRELFEVINFTVSPLIEKVEQVGMFEHSTALVEFKSILTRILGIHFGTLPDELKQELVSTYMEINEAFGLKFRGNQRAVQNILQFYQLLCFHGTVNVEEIRKFFSIGIPSVTWVRRTPLKEIISLSGMYPDAAKTLKTLADKYREPEVVNSQYVVASPNPEPTPFTPPATA